MSRAILLSMKEADVIARCATEQVGVSAIERLQSGGVRLVCMSVAGAELIREALKGKLIEGEVIRERYLPRHTSW